MTQPPSQASTSHGLPLGEYQGQQLVSTAADEDQILYLLCALDPMLDRCEETMEHTGHYIRAWLKSHIPDKPSRHPFSPSATARPGKSPDLSRQVLRVQLNPQHQDQLQYIWDLITPKPHSPQYRAQDRVHNPPLIEGITALPDPPILASKEPAPGLVYQEMTAGVIPPRGISREDPKAEFSLPGMEDDESDPENSHYQGGLYESDSSNSSDKPPGSQSSRDLTHAATEGSQTDSSLYPPRLLETLFQLCISLSLQEFRD
ncbi:hypothetical protein FE257_007185, partial [Aspergillus nanangensis]